MTVVNRHKNAKKRSAHYLRTLTSLMPDQSPLSSKVLDKCDTPVNKAKEQLSCGTILNF